MNAIQTTGSFDSDSATGRFSAPAALGSVPANVRPSGTHAERPSGPRVKTSVLPRMGGRRRRSNVSKRDLLSATMQLAIMARSGVDLATALQALAKQSRSPGLGEAFSQIHADVSGGAPVSEALARHSHIFGDTYVASFAAGEASGRLAEVLQQLAELQRSELRLHNTLRTLLGYPALLATVSALVLAALVFFVLPQFAEIFKDFETPLPVTTQILLAIASEVRGRIWLWCILAAAAVIGTVFFLRSDVGRRGWDYLFINVRILRDVTRSLLVGRAFRLLGTMLDSGVPLMEGLGLVRSSVRNSQVRDAFTAIEDDVLNGRGMVNSLLSAEVVPDTAAEMIATAERTGSLGLVANLIGEYLEEEGESRLRTLVAMLEPAIIIVMGALVALVVLSVMLPMFDLATLAQHGS